MGGRLVKSRRRNSTPGYPVCPDVNSSSSKTKAPIINEDTLLCYSISPRPRRAVGLARFWNRDRRKTTIGRNQAYAMKQQDGDHLSLTEFRRSKRNSATTDISITGRSSISARASSIMSRKSASKQKQTHTSLPHGWLTVKEKAYISATWQRINQNEIHGKALVAKAWLMAGEKSPVWIWGLIGVDEAMQNEATKNPHFSALITGVHSFFDRAIVEMNLDEVAIKDRAGRLGERHRLYFDDGTQMAYWESFKTSLIEVFHTELTTNPDSMQPRRSLGSIRKKTSSNTVEEPVPAAWPKFITLLTSAIRDGYVDREVKLEFSLTSRSLSISKNKNDKLKKERQNQCFGQLSPESCRPKETDQLNYDANETNGPTGSGMVSPCGIVPRSSGGCSSMLGMMSHCTNAQRKRTSIILDRHDLDGGN